MKRNHAFILYEHVGFLSGQCVINLFQRVQPDHPKRFISIWKPYFSGWVGVLISKMLRQNDLQERFFHFGWWELLFGDTDREIIFSRCRHRCCHSGHTLGHFASKNLGLCIKHLFIWLLSDELMN